MAVGDAVPGPPAPTGGGPGKPTGTRPTPPPYRHFAGLKLRLLRNGLRGQTWRIVLYVLGVLFGAYLAVSGFALFAATGASDDADIRLLVAGFGGGLLVLGWTVLPLVWFGVDDSLDPARFALLPLPPRRLVTGMLIAALLGVPATATLVATAGLIVPAAVHGGWPAALAQAVGVAGGLLLCVATCRAVTSAFAAMLRSRRVRDLAAILLAVVAALLGPLQLVVVRVVERADRDRLADVAAGLGWTPLAAPYTVGVDMADGRPWAAVAKLAITAGAVAALLWWWSRSLESAMLGVAGGGPTRAVRGHGTAVAHLLRRTPGLRATPFGALVARELRYWWRDTKRRANLVTISVIGLFVPVVLTVGTRVTVVDGSGAEVGLELTSPTAVSLTVLFVAAFATSVLANQFGFDGSAYAAHLAAGVPGARELRARVVGYAVYLVPLLITVGVVLAVVLGDPAVAPATWGVLFAGFGTGLAVNSFMSIFGAYALPESSNPFAVSTGTGIAKSLLSLLGIAAAYAAAAPVAVAAALLGDAWPWVALPVGLGYGVGAAALGCHLAGDVLDRRAPEVLAAVTPSH